jgi:FxsC-like protein
MPAEHESDHARTGPLFFLSYARTPKRDPADKDDPDKWVHKLYKDLCAEILSRTSMAPHLAGYMDRENRLGDSWPHELTSSLATCSVFVPLYSPRYFESENCGKEWCAFARREMSRKAVDEHAASAIVPVLWAPVTEDRIPRVAKPIQRTHHNLGTLYSTEGFYGIIKVQRYKDSYTVAVSRLAQRILEVAEQIAMKEDTPTDYHSLPNAFEPGPTEMQIAVLALDISSLPAGRTAQYYGDSPRTWSPYRPDYPEPLADYAEALTARCFGCQPEISSFDEQTFGNGQPIPPSLCLIDAWVAMTPDYRARLLLLDQIDKPWVSVLVPWNTQDAEMTAAERELRRQLRELLGNKLENVPDRCRMAAQGIPTMQEFRHIMPKMTMILQKRYRKEAPTNLPEGPSYGRPRLSGSALDPGDEPDE